jgi:hypothetical protein
VDKVADIGGVEHASQLFYTARAHLSIDRRNELRPIAVCSPRPLRSRSAPLSATEGMLVMTLLSSFQEHWVFCMHSKVPTAMVSKICVSRYTWSQTTQNHVREKTRSAKRAMFVCLSLRICNPPPA